MVNELCLDWPTWSLLHSFSWLLRMSWAREPRYWTTLALRSTNSIVSGEATQSTSLNQSHNSWGRGGTKTDVAVNVSNHLRWWRSKTTSATLPPLSGRALPLVTVKIQPAQLWPLPKHRSFDFEMPINTSVRTFEHQFYKASRSARHSPRRLHNGTDRKPGSQSNSCRDFNRRLQNLWVSDHENSTLHTATWPSHSQVHKVQRDSMRTTSLKKLTLTSAFCTSDQTGVSTAIQMVFFEENATGCQHHYLHRAITPFQYQKNWNHVVCKVQL